MCDWDQKRMTHGQKCNDMTSHSLKTSITFSPMADQSDELTLYINVLLMVHAISRLANLRGSGGMLLQKILSFLSGFWLLGLLQGIQLPWIRSTSTMPAVRTCAQRKVTVLLMTKTISGEHTRSHYFEDTDCYTAQLDFNTFAHF